MVYSTRRFVLCLTLCHFVLVFFSPFSISITSLGEERANLSAFRTFVRFVLVWICRFPIPLGVWEGLRFGIVALPGLFSYLFFFICGICLLNPLIGVRTSFSIHIQLLALTNPVLVPIILIVRSAQRFLNPFVDQILLYYDEIKIRLYERERERPVELRRATDE